MTEKELQKEKERYEKAEAKGGNKALQARGMYYFSLALYHLEREHWEEFLKAGLDNSQTIELVFETKLLDRIPDQYKYNYILGAYTWQGCCKEKCRDAMLNIRQYGEPAFPPELDGVDEITVYRGSVDSIKWVANAMSWTTDIGIAMFFRRAQEAAKHKPAHIFQGKIRREDVIAYTDRLGQSEIIQTGKVYDVQDITDEVVDEIYEARKNGTEG